jgi:hypothetical protein
MFTKNLARGLLLIGTVLLIVLFAWEAFSEELSIIEVRRNIPLADQDPVYKDFFINGGLNQGLKPKTVVTATRKIQLKDVNGQVIGEVLVPVGNLKIIAVGAKISVARLVQEIPRDDLPMLEQTGVMIGDSVDLKSFVVELKKAPKKVAQVSSPELKSEVNPPKK